MSEQCRLSIVLDETNEEAVWDGDIPDPCRSCVETELQRAPIKSQIYHRLRLDEVALDEAGRTYGVRLSQCPGLKRLLVIESLSGPLQGEEVTDYFLCNYGKPGRAVETVTDTGHYL